MSKSLYQNSRLSVIQKITVLALLAFSGLTFLVNLTVSGWANEFYSASAMAGAQNWTAFLFGSLDPSNAISVDKPPASIWIMALSIRMLGLSSFSILLPQALMGIASTVLLYSLMRRYWGHTTGIFTGLIFTITPVVALIFRYNNPDAFLTLLSIAIVACTLRALEYSPTPKGCRFRTSWLAIAGFLIGVGFLTKQLQIILIIPSYIITIMLFSPSGFIRRIVDVLITGLLALVSAGWWVLLTIIVPASQRPYIGGSQHNSFLELTFEYNGFGRLTGNETGAVVGAYKTASQWGATGGSRLLTEDFATQIAWFVPLAATGVIVGFLITMHTSRIDIRRASFILFSTWFLTTWGVFSFMKGIFHEYYTVALAPPISALAAIAIVGLYLTKSEQWSKFTIPLIVLFSSLITYGIIIANGNLVQIANLVLAGGILSVILYLLSNMIKCHTKILQTTLTITLSISLLAAPLSWTAYTVATGSNGFRIIAGPTDNLALWSSKNRLTEVNGVLQKVTDSFTSPHIVGLLQKVPKSYSWAMATRWSQNASLYQLASGKAVMAIGGYNSTDPYPTLSSFKHLVQQHKIRYYLIADSSEETDEVTILGGSRNSLEIDAWVMRNYQSMSIDQMHLFDLSSPISTRNAE